MEVDILFDICNEATKFNIFPVIAVCFVASDGRVNVFLGELSLLDEAYVNLGFMQTGSKFIRLLNESIRIPLENA